MNILRFAVPALQRGARTEKKRKELKEMDIERLKSERITSLPPYLFKEIDEKKEEVRKRGVDIIDLGVGDPDLPTHPHIIEALKKAAEDPANHRYPSYSGMDAFNKTAAGWMRERFGVSLDASSEIVTLIGSKEGLAHIPLAFMNPGDMALVPDPGYPVYDTAVKFAGGTPWFLDLKAENGFLPDLDAIPGDVVEKTKLIFLNYPNNPTAATADIGFFQRLVEFAAKNQIIVCHDAAYTEMWYGDEAPVSFLQAEGAGEVGVEFHSLSKTFNMTGWRIAFAAGNAEVISGLGRVKSNIDSGAFQAVQIAGIEALSNNPVSYIQKNNRIYEKRRDVLTDGLRSLGFSVKRPQATFYVWFEVPEGRSSAEFATLLLTRAGIVATPGNGFGDAGEGYARMALTVEEARLLEALDRMKEIF